jgi:two-component system, LytTR family, response regulator
MRISCIIVEDEPLAQERTRNFIAKIPHLQLLAAFDNGLDALAYLKTNAVDLIFLDINLGELSGIQLLEATKISSQVIFTTAYSDYALKGYELNVTDYLMKPFTFERFYQAVEKVTNNHNKEQPKTEKQFLFVKTEYRLEKIDFDEISYIEGMRDYRRIHTASKRIMTLQTFREFEQVIPPHIICRVHKSFMVNISKITSIERDRISIAGQILPISDTYKKAFFDLIDSSTR